MNLQPAILIFLLLNTLVSSQSNISPTDDTVRTNRVTKNISVDNVKHSKFKDNQLKISILLYGTADQLRNISRDAIVKSMWAIQKIDLPLEKKLVIWEILKDNKPVKMFKKSLFELAGNILLSIPEIDLFNINITDWQVIDFFGSLPGLSRRQAGVIAYALKRKYGNQMLQNTEIINRIKGLICGFSPQDLNNISALQFSQISRDVFSNIGTCTPRQKKVLLQIAMGTTAFGPPQVWNAKDIKTLGLLISAVDKDSLPKIRPEAMEGINANTMKALSKSQLLKLTKAQVQYLNDLSLTVYRSLMGLPSGEKAAISDTYFFWLLLYIESCILIF